MNDSSWKWGFALFVCAVITFSAFVLLKPKPKLKIAYLNSNQFNKEFTPRPDDNVENFIQNDAYPVLLKEEATNVQVIMQVVLSLLVAAASLFIILAARFGPKDKHWAYATVGTILGFWLHGGLK